MKKINTEHLKWVPNFLTIIRMIISVIGSILFISNPSLNTAMILGIAGITDCLDGLAARKLNATSERGRKLDAISDKLYVGCLIAPHFFVQNIGLNNLIMMIPLVFEAAITVINAKAENMKFEPATHRVGKVKTCFLFPTVVAGLLSIMHPAFKWALYPLIVFTTILQAKTLTIYENEYYAKLEKKLNTKATICNNDTPKATVLNHQPSVSKTKNPPYSFKHTSNPNTPEELVLEVLTYLTQPSSEFDTNHHYTCEEKHHLARRLRVLNTREKK